MKSSARLRCPETSTNRPEGIHAEQVAPCDSWRGHTSGRPDRPCGLSGATSRTLPRVDWDGLRTFRWRPHRPPHTASELHHGHYARSRHGRQQSQSERSCVSDYRSHRSTASAPTTHIAVRSPESPLTAGRRALSVHVAITQRIPGGEQSQGCLLEPPGNVAYHAYSATHELTTQASRHHHTGRQGSRPLHRPGRVRGRCQPGSGGPGCEHPQRAHRQGNHLRRQRPRGQRGASSRGRAGRRRRRAQRRGSAAVTQPVSGSCPLSCAGS